MLRPGTVVRTDACRAYRNLGLYDSMGTEPPPAHVEGELLGARPRQWRWESDAEREERWNAERREHLGDRFGRSEDWASKYADLRLSHTAVVHAKKGKQGRQFVAMRRVQLAPEDAAVLQAAGTDPFLRGCVTWRKGGTQTVDGYWRLLRMRVAHRGVNTDREDLLDRAVLVHQWSQWAGPGAHLLKHLGWTVQQSRARRAADMEVARGEAALWEWAGEGRRRARAGGPGGGAGSRPGKGCGVAFYPSGPGGPLGCHSGAGAGGSAGSAGSSGACRAAACSGSW